MELNANQVKELREKTGAGIMDCKRALSETAGDLDKAALWLREKGIAAAAGRAGRVASEGAVGSYIHAGGKIGVLIEVNCETDFCAKSEAFQALVKELALQVAALNPRVVRREDLSPEVIEQERQIYASQAEGKPPAVVAKIVDGKIEKFYKEACLLEQAYARDPQQDCQRSDRRGRPSDAREDRRATLHPLPDGRGARRQGWASVGPIMGEWKQQ